MSRSRLGQTVLVVVAVMALVVVLVGAGRPGGGYTVSVVMESATSVVKGGPVLVNGFAAGTVKDLQVENGKAKVTLSLDGDFAPLHDGAQVQVDWKATLSERQMEVVDGPDKNAEVPDGGMLRGTMPAAIEIDDVLTALDAPTREKVKSLVARLDTTLGGSERDLNQTIASAGPAIGALGDVLDALGTDGPAIKSLVTRLDSLMGVVATRDTDVEQIITRLGSLSGQVASRRAQLRSSLGALPGTLHQAQTTLDAVPGTVDKVVPLLDDLAPATARLRPVAKNLRPILTDLRPLTAELRPLLSAADELLGYTPGLIDTATSVVPELTTAVKALQKPVEFLRPYTPEITGFLTTWGSAFANYDSNGNFARIFPQAGTTSFNENPGIVPPGITYDPYPKPGAVVGQAWTDATGSDVR